MREHYQPQWWVTHPGEVVLEHLQCNGWSQRELARRTGLTPKTINRICNRKDRITATTALLFERVLQRPAGYWMALQARFDEACARGVS
jgi:addiction module HigA family antidote